MSNNYFNQKEKNKNRKNSLVVNTFLFIVLGITIGVIINFIFASAFIGPGSRQPGQGNPDFWAKSGTDVYYSGGRVGIGTSTPADILEVTHDGSSHDLIVNSTSGNIGIGTTNPNYKLTLAGSSSVARIAFYDSDNHNWVMGSDSTNSFMLYDITAGATRLRIDGNGNVGIGTTSPSHPLTVEGSGGIGHQQILIGPDGSNGLFLVGASGSTHYNWLIGEQYHIDQGLEFTPSDTTGGTDFNTPVMVIKKSGNVGIGTTSPARTLDVNGSLRVSQQIYGAAGLELYAPNNMWLDIDTTNASSDRFLEITHDNVAEVLVKIQENGNVGIGTTSPNYTLDVNGNLGVNVGGSHHNDDPGDVYDVAEMYASDEPVSAGDVVVVSDTGRVKKMTKDGLQTLPSVKKSNQPYQSSIIGVVSSKPALAFNGPRLIMGDNSQEKETTTPLIALVGRVLVKVSTEGGDIKAGDLLTSSSIPGVAMKATKPGRVLGMALESFNGNQSSLKSGKPKIGKILVFINPH